MQSMKCQAYCSQMDQVICQHFFALVLCFIAGIRVGSCNISSIAISILLVLPIPLFWSSRHQYCILLMIGLALFLIGYGYFHIRCKPHIAQPEHANIKNVFLSISPDTIQQKHDKYHTIFGSGIIVNAPTKYNIIGHRIFFKIRMYKNADMPYPHQTFQAKCSIINTLNNGDHWFSHYLQQSRISWNTTYGRFIKCVDDVTLFQQSARNIQSWIMDSLHIDKNNNLRQGSDILIAMLTGNKQSITSAIKQLFIHAGIAHLFAVSGIHMSIIAYTLEMVLRLLYIRKSIRAFLVVLLSWIYVIAIGAPPSAIRALTMLILYECSILIGRAPDAKAALSGSALLHVLYDPFLVFNISFLLSYTVVAGIIVIGVPLQKYLFRKYREKSPLKRTFMTKYQQFISKCWCGILTSFAISFAAYIIGLPFSIETFGELPLLAIPLGMCIIPMASCAITCGALSIIFNILPIKIISIGLHTIACKIIALIHIFLKLTDREMFCPTHVSWPIGSAATITVVLLMISHFRSEKFQQRQNDQMMPENPIRI